MESKRGYFIDVQDNIVYTAEQFEQISDDKKLIDFAKFCDEHKTGAEFRVGSTVITSVTDMISEWRHSKNEKN